MQIERWLAKQKTRLLACEHDPVIFTRPHELNALWLANVAVLTLRLCASGQATLWALLGDAKSLGAKPGMSATLHPWRQTLLRHPPIHALVTGGGLNTVGRWVAVRHGWLRPRRVVMAVLRGKLLAAIRQALELGRLTLPGQRRQQVEKWLNNWYAAGTWRPTRRAQSGPGAG